MFDNPGPSLRPYSGERSSEHFGSANLPRTTYASDTSGTKIYEFNSSGFRGESLDQDAAFRLFVCGPSYAFGTGLNWDETWGFQLKSQIAMHLGLDSAHVNLLNFSQSLASASYVTRTVMAQCESIRPDLVVALYSFCARSEIFLDGQTVTITPTRYSWPRRLRILRTGWYERLARHFPDLKRRKDAGRLLRAMNCYHGIYSEELGVANTLTQILLLQNYCRARGIKYLVSWGQHDLVNKPRVRSGAGLAPLIELLDHATFCPFSISDKDVQEDYAADGIHPGPRASSRFATLLMERYLGLQTSP